MPPSCNINRTGRVIRFIYGIIILLAGLATLIFRAIPDGGPFWWGLTLFLLGGGIFALFEARCGWCAIRAMGVHTPW